MVYLQLKSTNPDFSYILRKNPQSGMLIKSYRKGTLFAWYANPEIFNIYFRDSDTGVSYSNDKVFEYMDETRYNAPLFLYNAFTEFLNHMRKTDDKDIAGYDNELMINQIKCRPRSLESLKSNFTDYDIKFEEVTFHNYRVVIRTKKTLQELISVGQLLSVFNSLLTDNLPNVTTQDIDKYMNLIHVTDAPYYIRHLFKIYFLKTNKIFKKYKLLLETTSRENMKLEFEFGSNITQRIIAISRCLDFNRNINSDIIDIGCGEGTYIREFAPKLTESAIYHAIDTNLECIEKVKKLCDKKQIENVSSWSSLDEFIKGTSYSDNYVAPQPLLSPIIILTEVIEHMSKEEASKLLLKVLKLPFRMVIITTPNKDFNENYKVFDEDMRDEDHIVEMTKDEFQHFISDTILKSGLYVQVQFFEIGDRVNDIQPTLAVSVGKKDSSK